ncbi:MAG: NADP-dependent phosphogluconate dehydrogenase [Gemmatimonadaceae bacterium]|nr:NADP-dependent phosphogluconate dehydrogenase [Gemmatimonadaceae bacterium]
MSAMSVTPQTAQFGVIGLGVMGENLALNMEDHGYRVALWTHTEGKVERFLENSGASRQWVGTRTLEEFTAALVPPRRILLMVKAGEPVDEMLDRLAPLLSRGDVVIDGGNSFFRDTQRREAAMRARGIYLVGMGVSGGEEGARYGPSLMPGGARAAYDLLRPVLESIAAKTESGPCVTYVGPDGAGHFVKMVHNGIEYGLMQAIAEAYDLLRRGMGLPAEEVAGIFAGWNRGPLESYLIEVAAQVLGARDPETGNPLVEMILDQAGQKGTGKWTAQSALDLGVPIPTIAAAIDARMMSGMKGERVTASTLLASATTGRITGDASEMVAAVHDALRGAMVCAYAQGMSLLRVASTGYGWGVDLQEIARIWKGGCIIRARLLDTLMHAFERAPDLPNLLLDIDVRPLLSEAESGWRCTVAAAVAAGVPVPAMSAALAYFDSYRSARLPQNLTQAQRDFFGAHTYERVDRPDAGFVHTDWRSVIEQSAQGEPR